MKKLLALMLVLSVASVANATLQISVDGLVDVPDTEITLVPSDTVVIDVFAIAQPATVFGMLFTEGCGTLDFSNAWQIETPDGVPIEDYSSDPDFISWLVGLGYNPVSIGYFELAEVSSEPMVLDGVVIDNVIFHCTCEGDATIYLFNTSTEQVLDSQVIHQVPEPASMLLLGLGGLLLRRRK